MKTNVEVMDLFMTLAAQTKRPIGPPPPPPPELFRDKRMMPDNNMPPPPPPPPPVGCGRALVKLYEKQGITLTDLAKILGIRNASASEAISKLDKKGLIERRDCDYDGRSKGLYLTELGIKAAKRHIQERKIIADEFLSPLAEEEKELFYDILKKLVKECD